MFVVIDRFSKYAMFIVAPNTCIIEVAANLFYRNVVKYFSLLEYIMSDRDFCFTSSFWIVLFRLLGTQLKFSTVNHSQTDGQIERINVVLED